MVSGVSILSYWSANFTIDILKHLVPAIFCILMVLAYVILNESILLIIVTFIRILNPLRSMDQILEQFVFCSFYMDGQSFPFGNNNFSILSLILFF